jgi:hypothetical protein
MSVARESIFTCTYAGRSGQSISAQISAWSAAEAAQAFREELTEGGVKAQGEIQIRAPRRGATRKSGTGHRRLSA